jgi:hypothetical protein
VWLNPRPGYSDVQKSVPVKLARLLPYITIGYHGDSHPRINSVLQKPVFRCGLLEKAIDKQKALQFYLKKRA